MTYTINIFIADTSALKNRALMFAFVSSPYVATTWIGGPVATSFLNGAGYRWGYGTFAIVTPVITAPLIALFLWNYMKARKSGLLPLDQTNRSWAESIKYYVIEFDVVGILLICAGLALFLLPFSLYSYQPKGWKSPMIIAMIIVGGVLLIAFGFYEKFIAPKCFIPYELLSDRTIVCACLVSGSRFVSYNIWDSYFSSFLQVVTDLSVTEASYVTNIYNVGACFWSILIGILIRWSGRFKWLAAYFGIPLNILGVGLMIYFRQPGVNIGFIVMCQIFIAFAGGTIVICEQMAVMAAASHQHVAAVLAVESMFSSIGGSIGSTIAAAIWTGVFPTQLSKYLPEETLPKLMEIYGQINVQLSYPVGSPTRDAIKRAYGDAQKDMLIGGTAVLGITLAAVFFWRDIKVKDFRQVKGNVV